MLTGVLAGLAAGALWGLVFVVPAWLPHWPPVDLAVGRMLAYAGVSLGAMLVLPLLLLLLLPWHKSPVFHNCVMFNQPSGHTRLFLT